MVQQDTSEVSLTDLFNFIRRGLAFAGAVAVLAGLVSFFLSRNVAPTYQARATLLVSQPDLLGQRNFGGSLVTAPAIDVSAYRSAILSASLLQAALARLGEPATPQAVEAIRRQLTVRTEAARASSLIHLEVRAHHPARAASLANALAQATLEWDQGRAGRNLATIIASIESQIQALDQQLRMLGTPPLDGELRAQYNSLTQLRAQQLAELNTARVLRHGAVGHLEVLEPALAPLRPVAPRPALNAALAFVLAVLATYGLLLLRESLDARIKGSEDLARLSNQPILAEFPRQSTGRRLPLDASNYLRTNLLFATADAHPRVILVTSSASAEGKSSVALSLAESFARNGQKTLLVDADLRAPVLGKEYNLNPQTDTPLISYLETFYQEDAPVAVPLGPSQNLEVVPSFEAAPNPTELLGQGFRERLDAWRQRYEVIIIDSAPVLPVADTLTIAPHCTGVVVVVSLAEADRRSVKATLETLQRIGVRVLGMVATNLEERQGRQGGYGYGYGYGHGYGAPSWQLPNDKPARAKRSRT
jgi:non-specific protein-tyrosine kinase